MRLLLPFALVLAGCRSKPQLPVLAEVPPFALTDQAGRAFSSNELAGHIWAADLIFTNCPGACPRMSSQLQRVQAATGSSVKLASFTVDPDRDTPAVLSAYAKRFQADPSRWSFLSGPRAELDKVFGGMLLGKTGLDHPTRFILIDGQMRVRAYYQSDEPGAVERLLQDVAALEGK